MQECLLVDILELALKRLAVPERSVSPFEVTGAKGVIMSLTRLAGISRAKSVKFVKTIEYHRTTMISTIVELFERARRSLRLTLQSHSQTQTQTQFRQMRTIPLHCLYTQQGRNQRGGRQGGERPPPPLAPPPNGVVANISKFSIDH